MGWEYHRRQRGSDGRFIRDKRRKGQLHLRVTPKQAEIIRTMATKERMGLTEFVLHCITGFYARQRKENGYQRRTPPRTERNRGDYDGDGN